MKKLTAILASIVLLTSCNTWGYEKEVHVTSTDAKTYTVRLEVFESYNMDNPLNHGSILDQFTWSNVTEMQIDSVKNSAENYGDSIMRHYNTRDRTIAKYN